MSILNFVGEERKITQWDVLEGCENYYPDPALAHEPKRIPELPGFYRYTFKEPMPYQINELAKGRYEFVANTSEPPRPWLDSMKNMVHDRVNNILVGLSADGRYVCTVGVNRDVRDALEYTYIYMAGDGLTKIGHARV